MRYLARAVTAVALAAFVMAATVSGAAAAPRPTSGCTDSWTNTSGGAWDTATNWSTGAVPGSSDSVCITAPGTYTVVIGNETFSIASLTTGATGSTPTLQIGNGGAGFPHVTITGAIANAATISYGWGGTFSAGSMTNSGTFTVPSTGYGAALTFGSVSNAGTFSVAGGATLSLSAGTTFDNAGGTISNAASSTLAISTSGSPAATLQLDSGGVVNNSGAINVADTLLVNGGSICGNSVNVGSSDGNAGGTLTFASTPGTGPACGTGVATDQIFIYNVAATLSGTIPSAYTVTAGDGGSGYFALALSGNVINDGTFVPGFGGTISSAAATDFLTNNGTTTVPVSNYNTVIDAPLVNNGQLNLLATTLSSLPNGTAWSNASTGTITIGSHVPVALSSPSGQTATLIQAGVINNSGTLSVADAVTVNGGTICGNAVNLGSGDNGAGGTLSFATSPVKGPACAHGLAVNRLFIYNVTATITTNIPSGYTVAIGDGGSSYAHVGTPGNLTNSGTLAPGWGATLTVNGTFTNAGAVTVPASGYNTTLVATSVTNNNGFTLNAPLTVNPASGNAFTNGTKGKLTLVKGILAVTGPVINDGTVTIDPKDALDVNNNGSTPSTFTQASGGTLVVPAAKILGALNVAGSGTASLAGSVNLSPTNTFLPAFGTAYPFINAGSVSGTFATVTGPYTISYGSTQVQAIGHATPPSVVLSPTSGPAGTLVKVTGGGYKSGETVNVYLDSTASTPLAKPKASSTGTISITVTIPTGTSTGGHSVITVGQTSSQTGSATFTVT